MSSDAAGGRTVLSYSLSDRLVLLGGLPVAGLLVGWLLPPFARWILTADFPVPWRGAVRLVGYIDRPWEVAVAMAVCALLGLGVGVVVLAEAVTVTVTSATVHVRREGGAGRSIDRAEVSAVFLDGRRLVLLDRTSRPLVSDVQEARPSTVAEAFRSHGYPWRDADPHAHLFRRWVPGNPELPPAVDAVLTARERALRKKTERDIRELREAVEQLGFVVREEGSRQYWRPLVRS